MKKFQLPCLLAAFAGSLGSLLVLPVFFWWIRKRFVLREEDHMAAHFGETYRAYQKRVRRWL